MNRLGKIKKLRTEGFTLVEIGKKFGVSNERIRQLLDPKRQEYKFCKIHKRKFIFPEKVCYKCFYDNIYKNYSVNKLINRASKLTELNRKKELVYQRELIAKLLHKKHKFSSNFIAKIIKRDVTSVLHLLQKR